MKFHISTLHNALQRVRYAGKYGIWYFENEVYFTQFLNLKQGELSVLQYSNQFSRLKDACGMEDDEEHDLISFVRGLRPNIVERMSDCKTIHEAYWEAIRMERMLKRSYLGKVMPQDGPQIIVDHHVEEPVAEDIQIEKLEEDTSMGNGDIQEASIVEIPHINSHIDCLWGSTM